MESAGARCRNTRATHDPSERVLGQVVITPAPRKLHLTERGARCQNTRARARSI